MNDHAVAKSGVEDSAAVDRIDVEALNTGAKKKGQPLYAARKKVFPKRASGDFRKLKWIIMLVTLGVYYVTPWLRWDRGPHAPDQAVLVDMAHRRFYFFFLEIWPQEFYYVAGLLVMAGVGLFLITSVAGRAWCGYTCPQTVWTDLFLVVERFFEGDRNARIKLDKASWSFDKIRKRIMKHAVWILIAIATGGAWIFYFADAPTLAKNFVTGQAPFVAYATVGVLTATTYIFGGIMREQVCIYMCPWPRIQAAMLDEDSLVVTYNDWRGEPRSRHAKKAAAQGLSVGDCVDCNACVAVCPTGIDIRDGQQLECITCALCIDACDDVMARIGKPRGLIDYMALSDEARERAGQPPRSVWKHILRPRTIMYTALWSLFGIALVFALFIRSDIEVTVAPVRNPTFVTLSDGSIRNTYDVRLRNKHGEERPFQLSIAGDPALELSLEGRDGGIVPVPADTALLQRVYVVAPKGSAPAVSGRTDLRIWVEDLASGERAYKDTTFNGKGD